MRIQSGADDDQNGCGQEDCSGLARPVGAEQAEDLTGVDRKRQRINRRKRAEAAGQFLISRTTSLMALGL
jgi:hypothetical protein